MGKSWTASLLPATYHTLGPRDHETHRFNNRLKRLIRKTEQSKKSQNLLEGLVWLIDYDRLMGDPMTHYREFVTQGMNQESIWRELKRQIFLGDDTFVSQMQEKIKGKNNDVNFPTAQRRTPALPLAEYQKSSASRNEAIVSAYATGEYSYQQIADFFELHFTIVGKVIRAARLK